MRYLESCVFLCFMFLCFNPCTSIFCVTLYTARICTEIFRNTTVKIILQGHSQPCVSVELIFSINSTNCLCPPADPSDQMARCPSRGIPLLLRQENRAQATWHVTVTVSFLKGSFHFNFPLTIRLSNADSPQGVQD